VTEASFANSDQTYSICIHVHMHASHACPHTYMCICAGELQRLLIRHDLAPLDLLRGWGRTRLSRLGRKDFVKMMKQITADHDLWDDSVREVAREAFAQMAGKDKEVDVVEFERWMNCQWLVEKSAAMREQKAASSEDDQLRRSHQEDDQTASTPAVEQEAPSAQPGSNTQAEDRHVPAAVNTHAEGRHVPAAVNTHAEGRHVPAAVNTQAEGRHTTEAFIGAAVTSRAAKSVTPSRVSSRGGRTLHPVPCTLHPAPCTQGPRERRPPGGESSGDLGRSPAEELARGGGRDLRVEMATMQRYHKSAMQKLATSYFVASTNREAEHGRKAKECEWLSKELSSCRRRKEELEKELQDARMVSEQLQSRVDHMQREATKRHLEHQHTLKELKHALRRHQHPQTLSATPTHETTTSGPTSPNPNSHPHPHPHPHAASSRFYTPLTPSPSEGSLLASSCRDGLRATGGRRGLLSAPRVRLYGSSYPGA